MRSTVVKGARPVSVSAACRTSYRSGPHWRACARAYWSRNWECEGPSRIKGATVGIPNAVGVIVSSTARRRSVRWCGSRKPPRATACAVQKKRQFRERAFRALWHSV